MCVCVDDFTFELSRNVDFFWFVCLDGVVIGRRYNGGQWRPIGSDRFNTTVSDGRRPCPALGRSVSLAGRLFVVLLLGFTGFYRVLPGFTGFYWVLLGFTGFYRVLPSSNLLSRSLIRFYLVLPSFTGFCLVLPSFNLFSHSFTGF